MAQLAIWAFRGITVVGGLLAGAQLFESAGNASQKVALGAGAVALGYVVWKASK